MICHTNKERRRRTRRLQTNAQTDVASSGCIPDDKIWSWTASSSSSSSLIFFKSSSLKSRYARKRKSNFPFVDIASTFFLQGSSDGLAAKQDFYRALNGCARARSLLLSLSIRRVVAPVSIRVTMPIGYCDTACVGP